MRRIVVRVDEGQAGWMVSVCTPEGLNIVDPYLMGFVRLGSRRVPITPVVRRPADNEPHAALCAGNIGAITALLDRIRSRRTESDDIAHYGRWLFECLISRFVWEAIQRDEDVAQERAMEIALRWPPSSDLHRLVWEAMRDAEAPLVAHPSRVIAITRLVPTPPLTMRTITGVPRVLFASSVPVSDPTIRPGAMFIGLLRGFDASGRCLARVAQGVTRSSLATAFADFHPDIVHLVAHGALLDDGQGALMLRDDSGTPQEADATMLINALTDRGTRPTAVILSACNTASTGESADDPTTASPLAAQLVAAGVPIVSAMAGQVSEPACRLYTRRLAEAIHEGNPIAVASAHGRRAALLNETRPSANIDWALPALFVAEGLDPALPLINPARAIDLTDRANNLGLRREPVFIGRQDVLDAVDHAVDPAAGIGVIGVLTRESTSKLGGTRMLREIGWRLLRAGHVPVLLGPYPPMSEPKTARELVFAILCQVVTLTEKLELDPFVPASLADDLSPVEESELVTAVDAAVDAAQHERARSLVRKALLAFHVRTTTLHPAATRDLLAVDFTTLAVRARALDKPFGPRTKVVLLCDDVHAWAAPDPRSRVGSALDCLLSMVDTSGLGKKGQPVPVVFTGSTTMHSGGQLDTWRAKSQPGFRMLELDRFAAEDAVLGFQWVLLHPWKTKPDIERGLFGSVYTAGPAGTKEWERILREVGTLPADVEKELYTAVRYTVGWACLRNDDEQALRDYAQKHPEYQL